MKGNRRQRCLLFLTGQSITLFGSTLTQMAIIWYITLTTSSGKMLTLSTLCGFLPQLAVSLFGGVWAGLSVFHLLDDAARIVLLTGFMGAFTTFSTFLFDSDVMLRNGDWGALALNLVGQIVLGLAALRAGAALAMRLV